RGGQYTLVQFDEETMLLYHLPGMTEENLRNRLALFKQRVVAPARLAGGILLVHETLDQVKQPRDAWLYNPGQRRVRRAPQVAYDNPGTAADNMRTSDQLDIFNGAPDRYDWKLVGKREIYVPYNAYKLQDPKVPYKEILTPLHMNPQHLRYELHRVWVVDATLKPGERHIYKRRTFYVDEDSWQILVVDQYDNRDQLWRVSEGHPMVFYNVPAVWTSAEVHTDLQAGRYLVMGLFGESKVHDFAIKRTEADYTPDALRREGVR
ncbi:MAG: outer membrane lipoprotein-sorting protein, partial [Thermoanaerobaculia bacterium]|nr:outer membrane lipoprotein-sorting protein [Thermoanaerobaculia bacterium]